MQTFQVTLKIDTRAVVPERFLQEARKEAQAEDATPFLKAVQAMYPEDDDQFMLAVVKNAFRAHVRTSLLDFMLRSQVGGSVSPVQVTDEIIMQPKAEAIDAVAEGGVQQLRIGSDDSAVLASVPNSAERRVVQLHSGSGDNVAGDKE
jgi:hypothetical protein